MYLSDLATDWARNLSHLVELLGDQRVSRTVCNSGCVTLLQTTLTATTTTAAAATKLTAATAAAMTTKTMTTTSRNLARPRMGYESEAATIGQTFAIRRIVRRHRHYRNPRGSNTCTTAIHRVSNKLRRSSPVCVTTPCSPESFFFRTRVLYARDSVSQTFFSPRTRINEPRASSSTSSLRIAGRGFTPKRVAQGEKGCQKIEKKNKGRKGLYVV